MITMILKLHLLSLNQDIARDMILEGKKLHREAAGASHGLPTHR